MSSDPKELDVLCEKPLIVHVGADEVSVYPPTLAQLNATIKPWKNLIDKAIALDIGTGKKEKSPKKEKNQIPDLQVIFQNIYGLIDEVLPLMRIFLAPRGKIESDYKIEDLKVGLNVQDMRRIFNFVRESLRLGELMTNAMTPLMPVEAEMPKSSGQE